MRPGGNEVHMSFWDAESPLATSFRSLLQRYGEHWAPTNSSDNWQKLHPLKLPRCPQRGGLGAESVPAIEKQWALSTSGRGPRIGKGDIHVPINVFRELALRLTLKDGKRPCWGLPTSQSKP
jgi:hypothetical protein